MSRKDIDKFVICWFIICVAHYTALIAVTMPLRCGVWCRPAGTELTTWAMWQISASVLCSIAFSCHCHC